MPRRGVFLDFGTAGRRALAIVFSGMLLCGGLRGVLRLSRRKILFGIVLCDYHGPLRGLEGRFWIRIRAVSNARIAHRPGIFPCRAVHLVAFHVAPVCGCTHGGSDKFLAADSHGFCPARLTDRILSSKTLRDTRAVEVRQTVAHFADHVGMVAGYRVAENRHVIAISPDTKPLPVGVAFLGEPQKELPIRTSVRQVVQISLDNVSRGSWHGYEGITRKDPLKAPISAGNRGSKRSNRAVSATNYLHYKVLLRLSRKAPPNSVGHV